jgi:hypothetical protein
LGVKIKASNFIILSMVKRIFYSITLLLVPLFLYSFGTVNKTRLTEMQTIAPAEEHTKNNDKTETVEEKLSNYKSELTKKETVEADVSEVAEVDMDDRPAVSQTKESEMIVQREVDPDGPQRIYSIQTGNFKRILYIQNYFKFMIREFNGKGVDYVRLVKVGEYYAVRLGKFNGYRAAKKFLTANQPLLSSAIILDNYPSKLIKAKKDLDRDGPKKIYSVQTSSFVSIATAQNHFKSLIREFNEKDMDYVRIVKIGKYYAVRFGKFDDYAVAKKFLIANQPLLSSAIILDNYPLRKTISTYSYSRN